MVDHRAEGRTGRLYVISVRGRVPRSLLAALGDRVVAAAHPDEGETVLTTRMADHAQLRGAVERMLELGVDLVRLAEIAPGAVDPDHTDEPGQP